MPELTPGAVMFATYILTVAAPPITAAILFDLGSRTNTNSGSVPFVIGGLLLLLWVPVLLFAPQAIIGTFYPPQ